MKSRIILTCLLVLWMIVIFCFSNQDSLKSSNTSSEFTGVIIDTVSNITNTEISDVEKNNIIDNSSFIIRKLAHFTLYFIFGIICYFTFKSYNISNYYLFAILFTVFYAFTDEVHQIFVNGRSFQIMDILIDSLGGFISINILNIFKK